jgi:hypothetical protein
MPPRIKPSFSQDNSRPTFGRVLFALLCFALAAGVFVPNHSARAGVVFVQSASALTTGVAAVPVSFSSNVTVGDVIAVFVGLGDQVATLSSITDTCGAGGGSNTYTLLDNPTAGSASRAAMAYAVVGKSGACTVTANLTGGTPVAKIVVHEVNGVNTGTPLAGHKITAQTTPGTGIDAVSSGNITTTQNGDYIFGASLDEGGNNTHFAAGTGYAWHEMTKPSGSMMSEDKVQPSAGSVAATFTGDDAAASYLTGIMAFQPAAGIQVSSRSDTLSDSRPSATSNHTIAFTTNTQITGSSTITMVWPTAFKVNGFDCGDIDAATSSPFNFNYQGCNATATAWGASLVGGNNNFVQGNADNVIAAVDHFTVAFKNNVTAGDLIVVAAFWDGSATALSVTDTLSNVYTAVGPLKKGAGVLANWNTQLFYAKNIQGGAASVTIKLSAAATSEIDLYVHEYSGADLTAPLDVTSVNVGLGGTADSGSVATHSANELIFGFEIDASQSAGAGSGFEQRSNFVGDPTEDKIVRTVGSYNATVHSGGSDWVMWMAAFKITPVGTGIMLTAPTDSTSTVHVATGTSITINIGSNATVGQQGGHWIMNPSIGGVYTISVGGTFGGSGNMLVAIRSGVTVQATVAESLSFTVSSVSASFPTTGILDNFNRADESPLANGTWSMPIETGHDNIVLVGNQIQRSGAGSSGDAYWSASSFGPDAEVYVTVTTKPADGFCEAVVCKIANPNSSSLNGYQGEFCSAAGTDTWTIYKIANNSFSALSVSGSDVELTAGDSIGLECKVGSQKLKRKSSGVWANVKTATDSSYDSVIGNIGVHVEGTTSQADDFGGGTVNSCSADDGATVNGVATTATSVPFGIISPNSFYQGCQDLIVSTNAGNGYSVTVQESSVMRTADGRFSIPDTTCDGGTCSESTAAAWTNATKNGFGHTCFNQLNHDCNAAYSSGTNFRQVANMAAGETAQSVMSSSTAATATGRVKYRLSAGAAQAAGTYTTIITYTILGTF